MQISLSCEWQPSPRENVAMPNHIFASLRQIIFFHHCHRPNLSSHNGNPQYISHKRWYSPQSLHLPTHRPRSLWVDAVCINQRDNKEKGHQVALVAKIYSNANCVLVWLGESNGAIHAGIGCFRRLADAAWKYGLRYNKSPISRSLEVESKLADNRNGIPAAIVHRSLEVDFDSSNAFFTQDWFARLWIVQEYVLTSSVKIYSGPDVLSHQELSLAGSVFYLYIRHPNARIATTRPFRNFFTILLQRETHLDGKFHII